LLAAACLLLALGVALPRSGGLADALPGVQVAVAPADAPLQRTAFKATADRLPPASRPQAFFAEGAPERDAEVQLALVDKSVETLEKQGRVREAQQLVEHAAANVNRLAVRLQGTELARAEPLLANTHELCQKTLGPRHPETMRTLNNLAGVYQVAVNSVPAAEGNSTFLYERTLPPAPQHPATTPGAREMAMARAKVAAMPAVALGDRIARQSPRALQTSVIPVLTEALRQAATPQERETLARSLGRLGPAAREAVPVLTDYLRKASDPGERQALLLALGQMGPAAQQAAPVLVASLQSPHAETRRCAGEALVQMGPAARCVLHDLAKEAEGGKDALAQDVLRRLRGPEGRVGVNDECACFSVLALQESQREIRDLARAGDVEVLVETVPTLAAPVVKESDERARELGARSVYLVIARDTPAVEVRVSEALRRQGLTADTLRLRLEAPLREKDYDRALVEGVREVARFGHGLRDKKTP
jgi:hypothetical protein